MMNKKISVIMSAYNASNSIENSINSILNQSYTNFEFLIIDDQSIDNTFEIIRNYSLKDKRIKIFQNNVNLGLTKSLNILIDYAEGEILARQDSDDISLKNRFEKQISFFNKYKVVTARSSSIQSGKKIPGKSFYLPTSITTKYKNPYIHGTMMIEKCCMLELGKYDETFLYAQDYKLFLELIKRGIKIKSINKVLYLLNTSDNLSNNKKIEQRKFFELARKEYR